MIAVRLQGGLGNQLFQYAAGLRLALRHGTTLAVDLSALGASGAETPRPFELDVFAIEAVRVGEPARRPPGKWAARGRRWMRALRGDPRFPGLRRIVERGLAFDPALLDAPDDVYLEGYWQSERYFAEAGTVLRSQLRFLPPPARALRERIRHLQEVEAVAIHVRRGDYLTSSHNRRSLGILPIEYYRTAVAEVARRTARPEFFVFSDDPGWCESNLLLPFGFTVVDGGRTYEDLRLMSLCRHHIVANSAFSWWGAWLGVAPAGVVVAPRRWFLDAALDTSDRVPASWIRL